MRSIGMDMNSRVEISLSPIEMDGETFISSAIRDTTERKQAEIQKLEIELQREKVDLLKRFISDASHDLRTPLTSMTTSLCTCCEKLPIPKNNCNTWVRWKHKP